LDFLPTIVYLSLTTYNRISIVNERAPYLPARSGVEGPQ
jgi:hypothetical protein